MTLQWVRQSRRHVAHVTWRGFASPTHGDFPTGDPPERFGACGTLLQATETLEDPHGWRYCQACMSEVGQIIETTYPED
jgi:hypothetical protein